MERSNLLHAFDSGWISSSGEFVTAFEEKFAEFCECKHAVAVSNGTVALHLALRACGVGAGDEVIIPDLSFIATANAVLECGARPVFADIEADTLCLDAADVARLVTSRTRAIMPVHLYGHPADMDAINVVAKRHGLIVIEDAAEAHGARAYGRRVGGLGDCAAFSFFGNKILTTGEGGMITTNDDALAARCRTLRDHAMSKEKRYWHNEPGYNYRITNMQAGVGCAQLDRAGELLRRRSDIFAWYTKHLAGVNGISLNRRGAWAEPCFWMVCAEFSPIAEGARDRLILSLRERGVDTRPYFYPMSDMPYFKAAPTKVAHSVYSRGVNLPTYFDLSEQDVRKIAGIVKSVWADLATEAEA
ncbi:MAG TPA: DegT/DnrJ/EryC1/StrS family aminotransferase [Roseiarcus sp.]|jgi:perosamine synthetase